MDELLEFILADVDFFDDSKYSCSCDDPELRPCNISHERVSCDCCFYGSEIVPN